ncbi:MAG TPA: hypothetical protein VGE63_03525 [Candidatus Paceibacterota bacterium]
MEQNELPRKRISILKIILIVFVVGMIGWLIYRLPFHPRIGMTDSVTMSIRDARFCKKVEQYTPKIEDFKTYSGTVEEFKLPKNKKGYYEFYGFINFDSQGFTANYSEAGKCNMGFTFEQSKTINAYYNFAKSEFMFLDELPFYMDDNYIYGTNSQGITMRNRKNLANVYQIESKEWSSSQSASPYESMMNTYSATLTANTDVLKLQNNVEDNKNAYLSISQKSLLTDGYGKISNTKDLGFGYFYKPSEKSYWKVDWESNKVEELGKIPSDYDVNSSFILEHDNKFIFNAVKYFDWERDDGTPVSSSVALFYFYDPVLNKVSQFNPNNKGEFYRVFGYAPYLPEDDHKIVGLHKEKNGDYRIDSIVYKDGKIVNKKIASVSKEIFDKVFIGCSDYDIPKSACYDEIDTTLKYVTKDLLAIRNIEKTETTYKATITVLDFSNSKIYTKVKQYDIPIENVYNTDLDIIIGERAFNLREEILYPDLAFKENTEEESEVVDEPKTFIEKLKSKLFQLMPGLAIYYEYVYNRTEEVGDYEIIVKGGHKTNTRILEKPEVKQNPIDTATEEQYREILNKNFEVKDFKGTVKP